MRIERFGVRGYGHFKQHELVFEDASLHVVYGPNEAGKTTLLSALRDLLFGVPHRSAAGFAFGNQAIALSATLTLQTQGRLEIERKKARKDSLTGEWESPRGTRSVDAAAFERLLGPMDRDLFEAVFGFTLRDLEDGGELLRHAGVRELLAGGALGGSGDRVQAVLASLQEDADRLWVRGGTKRPINTVLREARAAQTRAREAALARRGLVDLQGRVAEAEQAVAATEAERTETRKQLIRYNNLCGAVGLWAQSCDLRVRLDELDQATLIADVERARRLLEVMDRSEAVEGRIEHLDREVEEQEQRADSERPDEHLLEMAEAIDTLERRQVEIRGLRREVEHGDHRLGEERVDYERALGDFAPGLAAGDFERETWVAVTLQPVIDLLEEAVRSADELRVAEERRAELAAAIAPDRAALDRLGGGEDPSSLDRLLTGVDQWREAARERERARSEAASLAARVQRARRELAPALPEDASLLDVRLPEQDVVAGLVAEWNTLEAETARVAADVIDADRRHRRSEAVDDELEAAEVPNPSDLDEARSSRDAAWKELRKAISDGVDKGALVEAADALDEATRRTDRVADRMRDVAESVARRLDARASAAEARVDLEARRAELGRLEAVRETWRRAWADAFGSIGATPEPAQAVSWLRAVKGAAELAVEHAAMVTTEQGLADRVTSLEASLRSGLDLSTDADLEAEIATVRRRRDEALEAAGRRRQLAEACARLEAKLAACGAEVETLGAVRASAESRAREAWPTIGIDAGLSVAAAMRHARGLADLHGRARSLVADETRLALQRLQVRDFDAQVSRLLNELGRRLGPLSPDEALTRLHADLRQARTQETARAKSVEAAATKRRAADEARREAEALEAEIEAACEEFELESRGALRAACERAVERAQLAAELEDAERKLNRNLEKGGDPEGDRAALASFDETQLQAWAERLGEVESRLDEKLSAQQQELWALQEQERSLGGELSVRARAEYEEHRARLEQLCDEWIELRVARAVLSNVVDRFVRDHQPAILARASELIRQLTVGRYRKVLQVPGTDVLSLEARTGERKTPDALSTGTHQQLFLALRLAYVLEYAQQSEPLPLVMDDVLVNVDEGRQRATLSALAEVGKDLQVIYFTCHDGLVRRVRETVPGASIQTLSLVEAAASDGRESTVP